MKNRGSTPILTNLVGVHPRNIHTKLKANPCSGVREEVEKLKKFTPPPPTNNDDDCCEFLQDFYTPVDKLDV